jgi:hypothetical protein
MANHVNTNFNPNGDFRDLETWVAIAQRKASQQGISAKIIGGVVIGGVGIVAGVPALGGVIGAWLIKSAYDGIAASGVRLRIVRDLGCIAWTLDEVDFRTYVRQFGETQVSAELSRAIEADCELSNFAHNWLRSRGENTRKIEPAREESPEAIPPYRDIKPEPATHDQAKQQLEAVLNKPLIEPKSAPLLKSRVETWNPFLKSEIDIVKEASMPIKNLFLVGLGGSGKGVLLACILREFRRNNPDRKIFLINGKDDPKEYGYFDGVVDKQKRLNCESANPSTVAAWFEAAIADYDYCAAENDGALLVIDEGTIIGARLKTAKCTLLGDKLLGITSSGGSMNKNIWFVAQTPYVGANGSDLSAISQLTPIVIVHGNNLSVLDIWKSAKLFKSFEADEISGLINHSECDRAVYFGKTAKWYIMPKLKNHSGYDRDNQQYLPGFEPQDEVVSNNEVLVPITSSEVEVKSENKKEDVDFAMESNFSDNAQSILGWLRINRKEQWVKYKGVAGRDMSFIKFLSEKQIKGDDKDDAIAELLSAAKIEVTDDEQSIKLL